MNEGPRASNGWQPLIDGMADPRVGGDELARERQSAIHNVIQLMGCHCFKSADCEHVDAVWRLGSAIHTTSIGMFVSAIRTLPRPLQFRAISELAESMAFVKLLSANPEHRSEHR